VRLARLAFEPLAWFFGSGHISKLEQALRDVGDSEQKALVLQVGGGVAGAHAPQSLWRHACMAAGQ
jgi:hypothetical protein